MSTLSKRYAQSTRPMEPKTFQCFAPIGNAPDAITARNFRIVPSDTSSRTWNVYVIQGYWNGSVERDPGFTERKNQNVDQVMALVIPALTGLARNESLAGEERLSAWQQMLELKQYLGLEPEEIVELPDMRRQAHAAVGRDKMTAPAA